MGFPLHWTFNRLSLHMMVLAPAKLVTVLNFLIIYGSFPTDSFQILRFYHMQIENFTSFTPILIPLDAFSCLIV